MIYWLFALFYGSWNCSYWHFIWLWIANSYTCIYEWSVMLNVCIWLWIIFKGTAHLYVVLFYVRHIWYLDWFGAAVSYIFLSSQDSLFFGFHILYNSKMVVAIVGIAGSQRQTGADHAWLSLFQAKKLMFGSGFR